MIDKKRNADYHGLTCGLLLLRSSSPNKYKTETFSAFGKAIYDVKIVFQNKRVSRQQENG